VAVTTSTPAGPAEQGVSKQTERRALGVASGAHVLHDGYTDLIWVALPIWQAEFGLSYAAVGLLRTIFSGTMATLQIPASRLAQRVGAGTVLAIGTALAGLCYCVAGIGDGFPWLVAALLLGGLGAATQHPIGSALVARTFAGPRSLAALGTYNFAGDVGKVLLPAAASALILIMPWRPAYALLGLLGVAGAVAIYCLTPRLPPERPAAASGAAAEHDAARGAPLGGAFHALLMFGIVDSTTRGGFFVLLPFILIGKGASIATAGFALTLVFIGGAAGKLALGWIGAWLGTVPTICITKLLTAAGMFAILALPIEFVLVLLPFFGTALNGVTTVTYGSVPVVVTPAQRTRAFSVFYTGTLGALALAPAVSGRVADLIGVPAALVVVAVLTIVTIPLAFVLKGRMTRDK
jgi:MFS transporter, FSR family, fosmidomycin resistance protein